MDCRKQGVARVSVLTDYFIELDPTLVVHQESEYSSDTKGYQAYNDAGVEVETAEFLYGMIRLLKPDNVLETGTHHGIAGSYMAQALKDNANGMLRTIEFQPENYRIAGERFKKLQVKAYVENILGNVNTFYTDFNAKYQFIFLDTEPQTRFEELKIFNEFNLVEGGYVFIHDLHRHMHQIPNEEHGFAWPFGKIPPEITFLVKEGKLRPMHFPTPRGLTGFYKPTKDDHQWTS